MIDMGKLQSDNAKAQAKHNELQNALNENPIYPKDRHDSDADELSRPLDWQEQQARDMEEIEIHIESDLEYAQRIQEIE
jgi:hypothetical protein